MNGYQGITDDYYVNMNLNTEMELPTSRETVLHFFEQIRKRCPTMKNFYSRERGEFVLEEDKDEGHYRWTTVEPRRVLSGQVNPDTVESALDQHRFVLDQAPYTLSISPLDCESLNLMFGFDFTYRGNHNELVAEALGIPPAFEKMGELTQGKIVAFEPAIQFAMDEECRTQVRLSVETRTSAYNVRMGDFPEEQISVYLTVRRYGSLGAQETFTSTLDRLGEIGSELVDSYVVDQVLRPLQQAIALK